MRPATPRLPALTDAECSFIDHYLALVDLLGRINPARSTGRTYPALRAGQSLVTEAEALLRALELMWERGEREVHVSTLTRALRALDGERRAARVTLPAEPLT
ncbi:MAG TPA: hypothetical protein VFA45_01080 [Actinomycetes bacterium]|nr:hypothetical protein [Actinomycetes bacterium]